MYVLCVYRKSLSVFKCFNICFLLILLNEVIVHTRKISDANEIHRRHVRRVDPFTTKLDADELVINTQLWLHNFCKNPLYLKYVKDNPPKNFVLLTKPELDNLIYELFIVVLSSNEPICSTINLFTNCILSEKNHPELIRSLLEDNKLLSLPTNLSLSRCREEITNFNVSFKTKIEGELIWKKVPISPLSTNLMVSQPTITKPLSTAAKISRTILKLLEHTIHFILQFR